MNAAELSRQAQLIESAKLATFVTFDSNMEAWVPVEPYALTDQGNPFMAYIEFDKIDPTKCLYVRNDNAVYSKRPISSLSYLDVYKIELVQ